MHKLGMYASYSLVPWVAPLVGQRTPAPAWNASYVAGLEREIVPSRRPFRFFASFFARTRAA